MFSRAFVLRSFGFDLSAQGTIHRVYEAMFDHTYFEA